MKINKALEEIIEDISGEERSVDPIGNETSYSFQGEAIERSVTYSNSIAGSSTEIIINQATDDSVIFDVQPKVFFDNYETKTIGDISFQELPIVSEKVLNTFPTQSINSDQVTLLGSTPGLAYSGYSQSVGYSTSIMTNTTTNINADSIVSFYSAASSTTIPMTSARGYTCCLVVPNHYVTYQGAASTIPFSDSDWSINQLFTDSADVVNTAANNYAHTYIAVYGSYFPCAKTKTVPTNYKAGFGCRSFGKILRFNESLTNSVSLQVRLTWPILYSVNGVENVYTYTRDEVVTIPSGTNSFYFGFSLPTTATTIYFADLGPAIQGDVVRVQSAMPVIEYNFSS